MEDYLARDLILGNVEVEDFIGKKISHLYVNEDGEEEWYNAYVADVDDEPTDDPENPHYFVYYTDNLGELNIDEIPDEEYFLCQVIEDYVKGCVRFL